MVCGSPDMAGPCRALDDVSWCARASCTCGRRRHRTRVEGPLAHRARQWPACARCRRRACLRSAQRRGRSSRTSSVTRTGGDAAEGAAALNTRAAVAGDGRATDPCWHNLSHATRQHLTDATRLQPDQIMEPYVFGCSKVEVLAGGLPPKTLSAMRALYTASDPPPPTRKTECADGG